MQEDNTTRSLCHQCRDVFRSDKEWNKPSRLDPITYTHHLKGEALYDAAKAGCHLCQLLVNAAFPSGFPSAKDRTASEGVLENAVRYQFFLPEEREKDLEWYWENGAGNYEINFLLGSSNDLTRKVFSITQTGSMYGFLLSQLLDLLTQ